VNLPQGKRGAINANITLGGQPISQSTASLNDPINLPNLSCFPVIVGKNHTS